jgi:plastocyanin
MSRPIRTLRVPRPEGVVRAARRSLFLVLTIFAVMAVLPIGWAASEQPPAPSAEKTATVNIVLGQLSPQHLEIATGTTVNWVSMEILDYPAIGGTHVLIGDDGAFESPPIAPGTRWAHRFNKPGTYHYHCKNHALTSGDIVVTGPPVADAPAEQEVAITEKNPDDPTSWSFQPADLLVETGTTVVWRNNGKNTHTVTADGKFTSGDIRPGETWKQKFDSSGVFAYHCTPHPWMKAMVRVVVPGGPPPEAPPVMEHSAGAMVMDGPETAAPARTGAGPARLDVDVIETDPSDPNSWRFRPSLLELRTGDTVVWHNRGSVKHSITSDTGLFDSGLIPPGQTFERTFHEAGIVAYHCTPHPWMHGRLRVTEPGKDAPALIEPVSTRTASAALAPPAVQRVGSGPARVPVNIVEPDISNAMGWGFNPKIVDVKAGDTVVWHNTGTLQHSITTDAGLFDAGLISPGASFERKFDTPGAYAYHCTPHPWMKGVIRVTTAEGGAPPPLPAGLDTATGATGSGEQAAGPSTASSLGPFKVLPESLGSAGPKLALAMLISTAILGLTALVGWRWPVAAPTMAEPTPHH